MRDIAALGYLPPLPSTSNLVGSVFLALGTAFFYAWSVPIPRRLFATKMALGVASVITGSLAYALVWLIPIDHLRSWHFAVAVFALFNLFVFAWSYYVAWSYGAFLGALLMFTEAVSSALILLGVSSRIAVPAIELPGAFLVFSLALWGPRILRRGSMVCWLLSGWGPPFDDPNAPAFYQRIVDGSRTRALERGFARVWLAWLSWKRGDQLEAIQEIERATSLLGGDGAAGRRTEAYRLMGEWLGAVGEVEDAHAAASEAIAIARSLVGGRLELTRALAVRAVANGVLRDFDGAQRDIGEAKHLLKRVKDPALESIVRNIGVGLTYEETDESDEPD